METSDIVAISVVVLCGLLGVSGWFRWASGLVVGLLIGCLILGALSAAGNFSWAGQVGGFFKTGNIVPYVGKQMENIADQVGIEVKDDTSTEKKEDNPQGQTKDVCVRYSSDTSR